ncbi:MAG: hypothetical protein CUN55_04935 [Phototrophicales bacterium]|nr:MAG: hypothetical protein CUN55_04935 [Phototrophicales bacterium]
MKNPLKMVVAVLDRAPATTRGQSLVELSLTLPILLLMLLGLMEIGWLANNYLTLVDVTREAGRYGATNDPTEWNNGNTYSYSRMDCEDKNGLFEKIPGDGNTSYPGPDLAAYGYGPGLDGPIGFYDGVACTIIIGMQPLEFNDSTDDIAISVFAYVMDSSGNPVITGRFPGNSNECTDDPRDPFAPPFLSPADYDPDNYDTGIENQRGFLFRGNHVNAATGCRGSEFNISEITDLLSRTTIFDDASPLTSPEREHLPNNAFVLVEVFWQHHQLLGLPFFSWLADPIDLHVWSFFPVSAAEPTATPKP